MNRYHREKGSWAWNGEIGPLLAKARERQGLSLKEAERSTRIRSRYLEGLERENPRELPGRGYVQGFLKSYAEFLGLDVEELSRRFKRHDGKHGQRREAGSALAEAELEASAARSGEPRSGGRGFGGGALVTLSLALLVLALVVAAFYFLRGDSLSSGAPVSGGGAPERGASDGAEPAGTSSRAEPAPTLEESSAGGDTGGAGRIRARVSVQGSESWISVESDSGVEYTGIAQPGFSRVFESGGSLRITTGNAGAVELRLNGLEYGTLGESGEVTSRSFTLKKER